MVSSLQVEDFASEEELLAAFVDIVRTLDPDILIGYDVQKVICAGLLTAPQACLGMLCDQSNARC